MIGLAPLIGGLLALKASQKVAATVDVPIIGPVSKSTVAMVGIAAAGVGGFMLARNTDLLKG